MPYGPNVLGGIVDARIAQWFSLPESTSTQITISSLEARCAVDNIGDTPVYDASGLPEPGRRVRIEMRMRWPLAAR